jgi:DNA-binding CsgD family transcriptional regulator
MPPEDYSTEISLPEHSVLVALHSALEIERRHLAERLRTTIAEQVKLTLAQSHAYELTATGQARQGFAVLSSLLQGLLQQVIDLENALNPTSLEALGLVPALEGLTQQVRRTHGLTCSLIVTHWPSEIPNSLALGMFRATQTLLNRLLDETPVTQFSLHLWQTETEVHLQWQADCQPPRQVLTDLQNQVSFFRGGMHWESLGEFSTTRIDLWWPLLHPPNLTEREIEVLRLVAEGLTNQAIAHRLNIRPRTVKFHLDNVFGKLGVNTRTEAALAAVRFGWVSGNAEV